MNKVQKPPDIATVIDNVPPTHSVILEGCVVTAISCEIMAVTALLVAASHPLPGELIITL
jgi:hypothetical protein